jgi:hypothetical protein
MGEVVGVSTGCDRHLSAPPMLAPEGKFGVWEQVVWGRPRGIWQDDHNG